MTKPLSTIGRYHTIVPPITNANDVQAQSRPTSRSNTVMSEMNIDYFRHTDEHIIHTVTEENNPSKYLTATEFHQLIQTELLFLIEKLTTNLNL